AAEGGGGRHGPHRARSTRGSGGPNQICGRPAKLCVTTSAGAEAVLAAQVQLGLVQLLDVDVLEGEHPDVLDEPGRPVHVPDPGIAHGDLEVDLTVSVVWHQLHVVGQVEPAFGLYHIAELADDVLVLPVELQLHLSLVLLEIFGAHRSGPTEIIRPSSPISSAPVRLANTSGNCRASANEMSSPSTRPASPGRFHEQRWIGLGPCSISAARCWGEA